MFVWNSQAIPKIIMTGFVVDEFGKLRAYHKITAHWFLSDCRSRSQMFTEFGGGTRAPFPNSGWKSSLTEDSG